MCQILCALRINDKLSPKNTTIAHFKICSIFMVFFIGKVGGNPTKILKTNQKKWILTCIVYKICDAKCTGVEYCSSLKFGF